MEDGFTEWAAGVQHRLLRLAYLLTGDLQRTEDLVQEALVTVALRRPQLAAATRRLTGGSVPRRSRYPEAPRDRTEAGSRGRTAR